MDPQSSERSSATLISPAGEASGFPESDLLRAFFEAMPIIAFIKSEDSQYLYANPEMEKLLGLSQGQIRGKSDDAFFAPNAAKVNVQNDNYVLGSKRTLRSVEALRNAEGELREWNSVKFSFEGADGRRFVGGAVIDVTESRRSQRAVGKSQARLKAALEAGFDAFFIFEPVRNGAGVLLGFKFADINRNAERLLEKKRWELIDSSLERTLVKGSLIDFQEKCVYVLERSVTLEEQEQIGSESEARWYRHQLIPLGDAVAVTTRDITDFKNAERLAEEHEKMLEEQNRQLNATRIELQVANAQLLELAATDPLTGLRNRRDFQERLTLEVAESLRYHRPLSIVMLDVDNFKKYNDTFGHPAGDEVLRRLAQILMREARVVDQVARYGGEEFAVLLPMTDIHGAAIISERIRHSVEEATWPKQPVTVSIGCAQLGAKVVKPFEFVNAADKALYASKHAGRNRVTLAPVEAEA